MPDSSQSEKPTEPIPDAEPATATATDAYAERLERLSSPRWKQLIKKQDPYGWNLRRHCRGRVLDVGCGIGRGLTQLRGSGVGVDHNAKSIELARDQGLEAYKTDEFLTSDLASPGSFDTLLLAHVLEHLAKGEGEQLLNTYVRFLRPGGRLVLICPQERGYASDETHVRWVGRTELRQHILDLGATIDSVESFPLPRWAGKQFIYNESVAVGTMP